ncbi:lanthionine synthetase LanC family protein [Flammeovirga aprica]|uniref:lanthionine synthetase LanC family protein n=1 Tax=Flammeovirga aprica TaxID=29528 RepID=UPI001F108EE6|nr:lanthionine synthetase LanC family protein [Flammeovirga aprica]
MKDCFLYYEEKINNVGFYNGVGGLIYALTEAYLVFEEEQYLINARHIINVSIGERAFHKVNLEEGVSGYLLGLLHLYQIAPSAYLEEEILKCSKLIIHHIRFTENGIYWDEAPQSFAPVMGFLKGNSGIVFSLLEAQKQIVFEDNGMLRKVMKEALQYEDHYFKENKGWADTMNHDHYFGNIYKVNQLFTLDNKNSFQLENYSSYWDLGLSGYLLSREHFIDKSIWGIVILKRELEHFLSNPENKNLSELNKMTGVVFTLVALGEIDVDEKLDRIISRLSNTDTLSSHYLNEHISDLSLFKGSVGKAYCILNLSEKKKTSVLTPFIQKKLGKKAKLELDVWAEILEGHFKTLSSVFKIDKPKRGMLFYDAFETFFQQDFLTNTSLNIVSLEEKLKFQLKSKPVNWLLEIAKQKDLSKKDYHLSNKSRMRQKKHLSTYFNKENGKSFLLYLHPELGLQKTEMSPVDTFIISELKFNTITYQELLEITLNANIGGQKFDIEILKERIKSLLENGLIEEVVELC